MAIDKTEPLHFRRIDPARNMARFYSLSLQPTLFGEVSLVRNWGRIGTDGRGMIETFSALAEAETARRRLERVKRRKGYRETE
ncbi:WGR domain-containing protein [Oryzicola mucosus]|uniref:WGR domain-containing protein n=1 Tax=Oryzicola mucosus TaxID=2767425 RepID=A0A8J6PI78_9HYPH|nr:WGR domain-containing protein [Oryzicola mucosus]MBD0415384.1 WGR domain-containing protein [Oryzicola mucosus]